MVVEVEDTGEVPVNVIAASNTSSNDRYLRRCREENIKPHPARFPADLPRFIIGLCSEEEDLVLDPFAGSNMTGAVAQELNRRWLAFELKADYLRGSVFRFPEIDVRRAPARAASVASSTTKTTEWLLQCNSLLANPNTDLVKACSRINRPGTTQSLVRKPKTKRSFVLSSHLKGTILVMWILDCMRPRSKTC